MKTQNHIHAHAHHLAHGHHQGQGHGKSLEQMAHQFVHQLDAFIHGQGSLSTSTILIIGIILFIVLYTALYGRTIGLKSLHGFMSPITKSNQPRTGGAVGAGLILQLAYMVVMVGGLLYLVSLWTSRLHGFVF